MCGQLMWHLTENMNEEVADANKIKLKGGTLQILKFQDVKSKHH